MLQLLDASSVSPRKHREPTGVEIATRGCRETGARLLLSPRVEGQRKTRRAATLLAVVPSHSLWVRWRERTTPRSCEPGSRASRGKRPPGLTDSPCTPRPRCHRGGAAPLAAPGGCRHGSHRRRPGRAHRRNRSRGPASRGGAGRRRAPRVPPPAAPPKTRAPKAPPPVAPQPVTPTSSPSPTPLPSPARPAPPSPPDPPGPGARIMTRYEHHRRAGGNRRHRAPGPDRDRRGRSARDILRTRMGIPGCGEGVPAGTGSAIKGTIIGVWFPAVEEARQ